VLTQEESVRYLSGYVSVIWAVGRWLPGVLIAPRDPRDAVLVPSAFDVGAATGTSWVGRIDGHPDADRQPLTGGLAAGQGPGPTTSARIDCTARSV
jgi:Xaa-Pro aminopeptidase